MPELSQRRIRRKEIVNEKVKIDDEFKALIPFLADDEYTQLEKNVINEGCRDALVIWDGILLDGHNRLKICEEHDIDYKVINIKLNNRNDAKIWIIENQFGRRNLTPYQRAELALEIEPFIAEKAKEKQKEAGGAVHQKSDKAVINTKKEIAKKAGVSHDTIHKAKIISKKASEEVKEKLRKGETSINAEYQKIRKEIKRVEREQKVIEQLAVLPVLGHIVKQDAFDFLNNIDNCSVDLLLTDPPYMTDIDNIIDFSSRWVPLALSKIKDTGRIYIFTGAYPQELHAYLSVLLNQSRFVFDNILVWTYRNTLGPSPKMGYKLNWQACFYLYGKEAKPLDCPIMLEQFTVHDINAPDGRIGNRYHTWQKPDEIAERFIRHSTREGDLIIDPFVGTGTFILAASKLGRKSIGAEINESLLDIAVKRGCKYER